MNADYDSFIPRKRPLHCDPSTCDRACDNPTHRCLRHRLDVARDMVGRQEQELIRAGYVLTNENPDYPVPLELYTELLDACIAIFHDTCNVLNGRFKDVEC